MKTITTLVLPLACIALLSGCAASRHTDAKAAAQLQATKGHAVSGSVHFLQRLDTVVVSGEVSGLAPNAEHGFHIHEKGDCSSGDGMSTGGHHNPFGRPHAAHGDGAHHTGDLPSLKADASGVARFSFETERLTVGSGRGDDVVSRGLIVHRDPDDFKTQPTGNSGPRLACAVITRQY